jgi:hypothetical protein
MTIRFRPEEFAWVAGVRDGRGDPQPKLAWQLTQTGYNSRIGWLDYGHLREGQGVR